jgi:hypothetical protein
MPSQKRRRSVAFAPDDGDTTTREVETPFDDAPQANSVVWDAFCEEYHEGILFLFTAFPADEKKFWNNSPSRCNAHSFLSVSWTTKHNVRSHQNHYMLGLTNEKSMARLWLTTYVNISKLVLTMVVLGEVQWQLVLSLHQVRGG